jgi:hypothetical protein
MKFPQVCIGLLLLGSEQKFPNLGLLLRYQVVLISLLCCAMHDYVVYLHYHQFAYRIFDKLCLSFKLLITFRLRTSVSDSTMQRCQDCCNFLQTCNGHINNAIALYADVTWLEKLTFRDQLLKPLNGHGMPILCEAFVTS